MGTHSYKTSRRNPGGNSVVHGLSPSFPSGAALRGLKGAGNCKAFLTPSTDHVSKSFVGLTVLGGPFSLPSRIFPWHKFAHPSPQLRQLQSAREHHVSESGPLKLSKVYLKGHLRAVKSHPFWHQLCWASSAVRGSQFFSFGGGRPPLRGAG